MIHWIWIDSSVFIPNPLGGVIDIPWPIPHLFCRKCIYELFAINLVVLLIGLISCGLLLILRNRDIHLVPGSWPTPGLLLVERCSNWCFRRVNWNLNEQVLRHITWSLLFFAPSYLSMHILSFVFSNYCNHCN